MNDLGSVDNSEESAYTYMASWRDGRGIQVFSINPGLTKREYFTGLAFQALISGHEDALFAV